MLKKLLVIFALLWASVSAFAAADVNKATAAELDAVKGIGPAKSKAILDERKKGGDFKDWADFIKRVKGIGEGNAAKLSEAGLTVGGESYKKAAVKKEEKAAKKEEKAAKDEKKAASAKPAASAKK
jgi:competence protein ComEA